MTIHTYTLVVDIDGEPDAAHDTGVYLPTGKRDLACGAIEVDNDRLMFWTVEEGVSAAATEAGADPSSWPATSDEEGEEIGHHRRMAAEDLGIELPATEKEN